VVSVSAERCWRATVRNPESVGVGDIDPFGLLGVFAIGIYGLWSGWREGRRKYPLKDWLLLLQGEVSTAAALVAAAVIAGRWLPR
jgi:hypothetical protein